MSDVGWKYLVCFWWWRNGKWSLDAAGGHMTRGSAVARAAAIAMNGDHEKITVIRKRGRKITDKWLGGYRVEPSDAWR